MTDIRSFSNFRTVIGRFARFPATVALRPAS
jgi:hypothetical protein